MKNKPKKLTKLITVIISCLILLNTVIPTSVYALSKTQEGYLDHAGKSNLYEGDNGEYEKYFDKYLELYPVTDKKESEESPDTYRDLFINKSAAIFEQDFLEFIKNYEGADNEPVVGSAYPGDKELAAGAQRDTIRADYEKYIKEKYKDDDKKIKWALGTGDYKDNQGQTVSKDGKDITPEEEMDQTLGQTTPEEAEAINQLLKKEDDQINLIGPAFETITKFAVSIADAVINVLQECMMPGAPTAILKREMDPTNLIKAKLDARGEDDYETFFGIMPGVIGATTSQEVVPFIYYSPLTIFSNKIPAFDINFISTQNLLKNPLILNDKGEVDNNIVENKKLQRHGPGQL